MLDISSGLTEFRCDFGQAVALKEMEPQGLALAGREFLN
jgi:hypothetical protein